MLTFEEIKKFNPYHGSDGRFTSAGGAASFTYKPGASKAHDNAIRQEKEKNPFDPFAILSGEVPDWFYAGPEKKPAPKKQTPTSKLNAKGVPDGQVKGKNIINKIRLPYATYESGAKKSLVDRVAEAQGYKAKPAVVSKGEFDEAVKRSGMIAYRTISEGTDVITGGSKSGKEFADILMYGEPEDFAICGTGSRSFGGGIYTAVSKRSSPGQMPGKETSEDAWRESTVYGYDENTAVMAITLSPAAKIGDYSKLRDELIDGPTRIYQKFDADVGAYATAKGYDALIKDFDDYDSDYMMILNRSAMIICDEVTNKYRVKYDKPGQR